MGTVASLTANSILAPWRMIPCFSTAEPTMKPGHVVQEHERDVERVAQPDEPRRLVGRVHVERAAEHHRLVRDDADRLAADARQTR